ncbi:MULTISPECIES: GntP family permease [Niastella]|uniref:GntP family permease n=1 Tax=Niastella soli TaxID=2821487 RepID=A0ABS3YQ36_9BACT|nr:GntP family permease [Niastella soli]MBO9200001.1 GntP family permease [Niastella soli]
MAASFAQVMIFLILGIGIIILLTAVFRIHAFFALLMACFVVGLGVQLPAASIITVTKQGFGNIMQSLGFIIVLGTTLGVVLEHTGSTKVMATYILKKIGEKQAPLAMSITGFIVGLPIFCDSGYIVLSGLNKSLCRRTGISVIIMSVSLATGLYSVHCLIPPHPGAAAAASTIGVDYGKLIVTGIAVAIPAMLVGRAWARYAGRKIKDETPAEAPVIDLATKTPSVLLSFLPVLVPIVLIGIKSFLAIETGRSIPAWMQVFMVAGDPVIALAIGILLAFCAVRTWNKNMIGKLLQEAAEKAGGILVIIGAGGAFGAILAATQVGQHVSNAVNLQALGLLFPFMLTAILKTAQGSSTVAIITASSIIQPLLPALGLDSETGRLLAVLSMGAGSMTLSHANDAYFWVIAKFSGLDMRSMLQVYTLASLFMGLTTLGVVYILSLVMM